MKYKNTFNFLWPENKFLRGTYLLGVFMYVSLSIFFFDTFVPEVNPDTISYLNIARKYASGNFLEALNAYWSPLISWLLVPFVWLNIDLFSAFRIINIFTGFCFLLFLIKIFDRFDLSSLSRVICFLTFSFISFFYQTSSATPDFLSACLICLYLYLLTDQNRFDDKKYFFKVAITAALCFFSKSYFLAFFIIQFFLFSIWDYRRYIQNKNLVILNIVKVYSIFFIIIGIWISLISFKYEKFIVSSSGQYNYSLLTTVNGEIGLNPQYYSYLGLQPPPDSLAICSWSDPTYYLIPIKNPFESWGEFKFQCEVIKHNLSVCMYLFSWFSYLGLFILLIVPYLLFFSKSKTKEPATVFIFSSLIYLLGYLLIFYEERYVLPVFFILIICAFFVFDELSQKINFIFVKSLLLIGLSICFLKNPIDVWKFKQLNLSEDTLNRNAALKLKNAKWLRGKKIASSNYQFGTTSLIALSNHAYNFGSLNQTISSLEENILSLQTHQIDYYFCFDCKNAIENPIQNYLKNKPVFYEDKTIKLIVYKLR